MTLFVCALLFQLQSVLLDYIPNPQVDLVLVMLIVPVIVNSIMFWVVDSLMMRKYKYKSLDDSCDPSTKVNSTALWVTGDESQVLLPVDTDAEEEDRSTMDPRRVPL